MKMTSNETELRLRLTVYRSDNGMTKYGLYVEQMFTGKEGHGFVSALSEVSLLHKALPLLEGAILDEILSIREKLIREGVLGK